jgi:hypothetical protein
MRKKFWLACFLALPAGGQVGANRLPFGDFPVKEVFRGTLVSPKLVTKSEQAFRTRIRAGAEVPVEFAGHYTLPRWGCGAGCNAFVIVDSMTGRVYDVPFSLVELPATWVDEHGGEDATKRMDYRQDSRLLKINAMVDGEGLKLVRKELLPTQFQPKE